MDDALKIEELLREAGWLRALAASLVDPAQAEDLVQETWLATLRHPPRGEGSVRPWLARVVQNLAHNARRGRARRTAREELAREERPSVTSSSATEDLVQEAETQRLLAEAVTRLPEPLGAVIVLRYFQGLDSSAAAARLGLPASTVRTRLQRALDALRADLDRRAPGGRESWAVLLAGLARPAREAALQAAPLASAPPTSVLVASGIAVACLVGALGTFVWHAARGESKEEVALVGANEPPLAEAQANESGLPTAPLAGAPIPEREALGPPSVPKPVPSAPTPDAAAPVATAELSGTILVDGRPPEWPLQLYLSPTPPPPTKDGLMKRVPRIELALAPEQQGAFTFGPLPVTWTGDLRVEGYTFAGDKQTYAIDAPRPGLVLDVRSGPAIVGRLLLPDGRPASGLEGSCLLHGVEGAWSRNNLFRCRDDGRFRIPGTVEHEAPSSQWNVASLLIQGEAGYLQSDSPRFLPDEGFDFGELALEPVRSLTFVVRDPEGHPIHPVSARVVNSPSVDPGSRLPPMMATGVAETDESGSGTLDFVPDREVSVWFGGLGRYADRVVTVGGERAIEVVLEPVAALEVRLTGALVGRARLVMITSDRPAFLADVGGWSEHNGMRFASGSGHPTSRTQPNFPGQRYGYGFGPGEDGHLSLAGLVPGVPLTLEVRDGEGNVLASKNFAIGEREWAELEIHVP